MNKKFTTLCLALIVMVSTAFAAVDFTAKKARNDKDKRQGITYVQAKKQGKRKVSTRFRRSKDVSSKKMKNTISQRSLFSNLTQKKAQKPMRVGDKNAEFYGALTYSSQDGATAGFKKIDTSGSVTNMWDSDLMLLAWYGNDGNIHSLSLETFWGYIFGYSYDIYDFESGELLEQTNLYDDFEYLADAVTYDSDNNIVYMISETETGGYALCSMNPETPKDVNLIKEIDLDNDFDSMPLAIAYFDGYLYGITVDARVVKIDVASGNYTVLSSDRFDIPFALYMSAMTFVPELGEFVANITEENEAEDTYLYTIDTEGNVNRLFEYSNCETFTSLLSTSEIIREPGTPAKPIEVSNTFAGTPNLSGSFTITIPEKDALGNSFATGTKLKLTSKCGDIVGTQTKTDFTPGEQTTVTFNNVPESKNTFTFELANGELSNKLTVAMYCGYDTPKAPENVILNGNGITWDAVTEGFNKGYITDIKYDVYVDDEKVGTDVTSTTFAYTIPEGELAVHMAEVIAKSHGKNSEPGKSNKYICGNPLELPVELAPTEEELDLFTIIDSNNDDFTWEAKIDQDGSYWFCNPYNSDEDADDWLFLPVIKFDNAASLYEFSMDVANYVSPYQEGFEVYIGTSPTAQAMNTELIAPTFIPLDYTATAPMKANAVFNIPAVGNYYIGIHAISEADNFYLMARNFKVRKSDVSPSAPNKVTQLSATPADKGELSCSVSFKLPLTNMLGVNLNSNATITATAKSGVDTQTATGKPGENITIKNLKTAQGINEITVTPSIGNDIGVEEKTSVFTGIDAPGAPTNFKLTPSADNMSATMTWSAPTDGVNGGYVAPTGIKYYLCEVVETQLGPGWQITKEIGTDVFEYTMTLPEGTPQDIVYMGVVAETVGGQGTKLAGDYQTLGTPVTMPILENISSQHAILIEPLVFSLGSWYMDDPGLLDEDFGDDEFSFANEEGFALFSLYKGSNSELQLPRFSTKGANDPIFVLDALYGERSANYMIYASAYGMERELIGQASKTEFGYDKVTIEIPTKFKNLPWVQLDIVVDFDAGDMAIIQGYQIKDNIAKDLMLAKIEGKEVVQIGKERTYNAIVQNIGKDPFDNSTVRFDLKKGDDIIATETVTNNEKLLTDGKVLIPFTHTFSVDELGACTLEATITTEDMNNANNKVTMNIDVVNDPTEIYVTNLKAGRYNESEDQVILTWNKPTIPSADGTFESANSSVFNPDNICGFTNIDGDKAYLYGFQSFEAPNAYQPAGFTVWSAAEIAEITGDDTKFQAHNGDKYLIAFCPSEGSGDGYMYDADDWLISPEVKGGTDVSLFMCAISDSYGNETIELCYSATDNDVDAFKVFKTFKFKNIDWEEFSATLPSDAKYFAIHYCSNDVFGVMIDDISFTAAGSGINITGYDIYRDGVKIAENTAADCSFIDKVNDPLATYKYQIVPVLSNGTRGLFSNTATINMDPSTVGSMEIMNFITSGKGTITVKGYEGNEINIFTADGKRIVSRRNIEQTNIFNVEPGIYVVRVGKTNAKVIVR